jgi:nucleotide-binding universal stress UspA family protein
MSCIVLTTDLSDASRQAFAPTVELARSLGLPIVLLHVVPELRVVPHGAPFAPPLKAPQVDEEVAAAKETLAKWKTGLGAAVQIEDVVLTGDDVVTTITKFAADRGARFIALATHGRTGFRHLVLGSVAESIMRHATTPVVCFPPKR